MLLSHLPEVVEDTALRLNRELPVAGYLHWWVCNFTPLSLCDCRRRVDFRCHNLKIVDLHGFFSIDLHNFYSMS